MAILIAAIIFGVMYCLAISLAYEEYSSIRNTDPLGMLHSLFPFCYIVIVLFAALCLVCVLYDVGSRYFYILLLIEFSMMLWFTPYYLSGFSRETDSLWNVGIAKHLADAGGQMMFSSYYKEYPISFILNHVVMTISGIDAFIYARLIYPLFCIISIVLLWYVFVSRLFTYKIAFISTLIAILGVSPTVHICPQSLGTLLVLASAILLVTCRNRKSKIIGLLLIFTLITTHPISPLILLIFMIAPYIAKVFVHNFKLPYLRSGILATLCGWFGWALFHATSTGTTIAESIYNMVTLNFGMQLEMMMRKASHTAGYVFPEISLLSKMVFYSYLIIPLILFFRAIIGLDLKKGIKKLLLQIGERVHCKELLILSIAFLCLTLSVAFVFSGVEVKERSFYLWERASFYFILAVSAYVGSNALIKSRKRKWTYAKAFTISWFIFLVLAYPIINSEGESFLIYPPSEGAGMRFLQSSVQLSGKILSMFLPSQLASYIDPETRFNYQDTADRIQFLSNLPLDNKLSLPDVMVFRRTEYFFVVYGYDKSFENNRYTQALTWIDGSCEFNKIYSCSTFEVYIKFSNNSLPR